MTVPIPHAPDTGQVCSHVLNGIYHALLGPSPAPSPACCAPGHTLGYSSTPHLSLLTFCVLVSSFPKQGRTGCHAVGAQGPWHPGTGKPQPRG